MIVNVGEWFGLVVVVNMGKFVIDFSLVGGFKEDGLEIVRVIECVI